MVAGKKSCGRCWAGHRLDFNWRCSDQAIRVFSVPTTSIFKPQAFSIFFQYIFNAQTPVFEYNNRTDSGSHRYSVGTASLSAAGQQGLTGNHWFTPNFSCTPPSLLWHSTFIDTRLLFHHCIHKVSVGKLPKRMEGKGLTQSRFFLIELKFM